MYDDYFYREQYPKVEVFSSTDRMLREKKRQQQKKKQQRRKNPYETNVNVKRQRYNQYNNSFKNLNRQGNKISSSCNALLKGMETLLNFAILAGVALFSISKILDKVDMGGTPYGGEGESYDVTSGKFDETDEKNIIKNKIIAEAEKQGVDPALALGLAEQESNFNPKAKSQAGAMGLFQLMPATAKEMGVTDPYDIDQNIRGGVKYLKWCLNNTNTVEEALVAYNAGLGNLKKAKKAGKPIDSITDRGSYAKSVMERQKKYRGILSSLSSNLTHTKTYSKNGASAKTYDESSNITSGTKLKEGYNKYYNPYEGEKGTFMGKTINSGIGKRDLKKGSKFHRGLDLHYPNGTAVYSFTDGVVTHAGAMEGFGRVVIVDDSNKFRHLYAHLSSIKVSMKQRVKKGDLLGYSGGSTSERGVLKDNFYPPHLHYGIWKPGGTSDRSAYIDPRTYTYPEDSPKGDVNQKSVNVDKTKNKDKEIKETKPISQSKPNTNQPKNNTTVINNTSPLKRGNTYTDMSRQSLADKTKQENESYRLGKKNNW